MEQIKTFIAGMDTTDWIIVGTIVLLVVVVIGYFVYSKNHKVIKADAELQKKRKRKYWNNMYQIMLNSRIFKGHIEKLTKRLKQMSVYRIEEIRVGAAKFTAKLALYVVIAFVASCFLFDNPISIGLIVAAAYVIYQSQVEKSIQASVLRVYRELKAGIASVRLEYRKSRDVLVALENATYGNRVAGIFADIKSVVSSTNGQQALENYYEKVPFKEVQTFAMICYNINDTGDEFSGDTSTFDQALLVMNSDINQKIEQYDYEAMRYGKVEWLSMAGIAMTIILRYLLSYMMPSVAVLYNSIAGALIQNGVIAYSIYAYWTVAHAHIRAFMDTDDRPDIVKWFMKKKWFVNIAKRTEPTGKKRRMTQADLIKAFSKRTTLDFHAQRLVYAMIIWCVITFAVVTAPFIQKNYLWSYTKSFDLVGSISYEDDKGNEIISKEDVLRMDKAYYNTRAAGDWEDQSDEEIKTEINNFLLSYMPKLTTMELEDQRNRLEAKYQNIKNANFHWYYILLPYLAAVIAYMMPKRGLKKRIEIAKEEEEEEFLQLQVVMMVLASMNFDTRETLGHLVQIADIHKSTLARCYYGYAANPIEELDRVQRHSQSENFKQFIAKLKETVEDLSIQEAFADLQADRSHIMNERSAYIRDSIDRKRASMGQLALKPMLLAIYGMLVFPLMYTGLTQLNGMTERINEL